jgi:lipopolysaccharide/colanic/teichoic acid biosynthesis glycosyltransferase
MSIERLTNWFTANRRRRQAIADNVQPAHRFVQIVDRERKRVERGGGTFSLLVLNLAHSREKAAQVEGLAAIFERRLRATDVAGYLDGGRIAVVLAGTPERLAWQVADDIVSRCQTFAAPSCEVYVYPTHPLATDNRGAIREARPEAACQAEHQVEALMFVEPLPWWKRSLDLVGATAGLIALSPVMLAAAAAIKLTSKGPVFFKQQREGLGGRHFTCFKFRTMVVDAEAQKAALRGISEQDGPAFKLTNDPRTTTVGRYLRKTCIDELPQLLNVLRGEMSLVGPRPLPIEESQQCANWQRRRLEVTPGLTCIWQIDGKSRVPFVEWMRMDIRYIKARNLFQDVKLVVRTMLTVLLHRGSG